jgi:hypothetical protein
MRTKKFVIEAFFKAGLALAVFSGIGCSSSSDDICLDTCGADPTSDNKCVNACHTAFSCHAADSGFTCEQNQAIATLAVEECEEKKTSDPPCYNCVMDCYKDAEAACSDIDTCTDACEADGGACSEN